MQMLSDRTARSHAELASVYAGRHGASSHAGRLGGKLNYDGQNAAQKKFVCPKSTYLLPADTTLPPAAPDWCKKDCCKDGGGPGKACDMTKPGAKKTAVDLTAAAKNPIFFDKTETLKPKANVLDQCRLDELMHHAVRADKCDDCDEKAKCPLPTDTITRECIRHVEVPYIHEVCATATCNWCHT